jgi:hypothetical protein
MWGISIGPASRMPAQFFCPFGVHCVQ